MLFKVLYAKMKSLLDEVGVVNFSSLATRFHLFKLLWRFFAVAFKSLNVSCGLIAAVLPQLHPFSVSATVTKLLLGNIKFENLGSKKTFLGTIMM